MRKSKRQKIQKYVVVFILVATTLGFLIPGFVQSGNQSDHLTSPGDMKICRSDSECYLTCDGTLTSSICYKNICELQECDQYSLYPFTTTGTSFGLEIVTESTTHNLLDRYELFSPGTFFVVMSDQGYYLYTDKIPLNYVLEKVGMNLAGECLIVNPDNSESNVEQFCNTPTKTLTLTIDGEDKTVSGDFLIKKGDNILLEYN